MQRKEKKGRVSFDFMRHDYEAIAIIEDGLQERTVNLKVADDAGLEQENRPERPVVGERKGDKPK